MEEVSKAWEKVTACHDLAQLNFDLAVAYLNDAEREMKAVLQELAEAQKLLQELR